MTIMLLVLMGTSLLGRLLSKLKMLIEIRYLIFLSTFLQRVKPKWLSWVIDLTFWAGLLGVVMWNCLNLMMTKKIGIFVTPFKIFLVFLYYFRLVFMQLVLRKYYQPLMEWFTVEPSSCVRRNWPFRLIFVFAHIFYVLSKLSTLNYKLFEDYGSILITDYFAVIHMLLALIYLDVLKKRTEDRMLLFRQQCLRARTGWGVTELWNSETSDLTILKSIQLFQKLFGTQLIFFLWILICLLAFSYSNKLGLSESDQLLILGCGILNLVVLFYGLIEKCLSLRRYMAGLIGLINEIVEYLSVREETSAAAQNLKRSLTTLKNLMEMHRPYFSALGVYEVEHDLVLVVFTSSISCYLIMLK